jgi:chitodextrinase
VSGGPRIVAAAFFGALIAALVLLTLASASDAGGAARVSLQIAPRGLGGSVTVSPPGLDSNNQPLSECVGDQSEDACAVTYDRGQKVTLSPAGQGNSFVGWSTPDCPGTAPCTLTLNDDLTSIIALFNPLHLMVRISPSNAATITTKPAGQPCGDVLPNDAQEGDQCFAFPPHIVVNVTETSKPGAPAFQGWNSGCEPTNQPTCTVTVEDEPTWVGGTFAGSEKPQLPTTIDVQFALKVTGAGSGRVTGKNLDCGTVCSGKYGYGTVMTLTAAPASGSLFDGWNGVCAKTATTCTFPVGPITSIKATFTHDDTPPTTPGNLTVTAATRTSLTIGWSPATDNVGVTGYRIYVNDTTAADTQTTSYTFGDLVCGRSYAIAVDATDAVGNRSARATLTTQTKACALAARLANVGVERVGRSRRVLVKLRVNRTTTARLTLLRNRQLVTRRSYRVLPGTNALRMTVPRSLAGGPYRLTIALVNPDGGTLNLPSRGIHLPQPR